MKARLFSFWRQNWPTVLVVVALVGGYLALHTRPSEIGSAGEFVAGLRQGEPTVVVFYSNT